MSSVYLNKVNLYISYNNMVRAKGKRSKHVSQQTVIENYSLEMILNESADEKQILKIALFKLRLKVKANQKCFLKDVVKIKKLGL